MTKFKVLYALRTDGELDTRLPNGKTETNAPTSEQLSKVLKTDAKTGAKIYDYYRELTESDNKHIDWRLKLAALYAKHCGDESMKANPTEYILAKFPDGYRLFEHIKTREDASSDKAGKKGHAGGGHDRQDAYLYGYPGGRKKRFRSPAEFFHHLKYMIDPDCKDWRDCACKFCAPDEVQPSKSKKGKKDAKKLEKPENDVSTTEVKRKVVENAPPVQTKSPAVQIQPMQQMQPQIVAPVPTSTDAQQPGSRLPTLAPSPLSSGSGISAAGSNAPKRASKAKKELVFVNQTPQHPAQIQPQPQPQMQTQQLVPSRTPSAQQTISPQWVQAPAHASHLSQELDQATVDWMRTNAPKEYQMWGAWVLARFPSQKDKDDLHRNLIDNLDYMVWLGHKIPGYFPRKVSTIGPDGNVVNSGRPQQQQQQQQQMQFQQHQVMSPQGMYMQQPVGMPQQMHQMPGQQQQGMQQAMQYEQYPQQYHGQHFHNQQISTGYDPQLFQSHMAVSSNPTTMNTNQISEDQMRMGDYLHLDRGGIPPNNPS